MYPFPLSDTLHDISPPPALSTLNVTIAGRTGQRGGGEDVCVTESVGVSPAVAVTVGDATGVPPGPIEAVARGPGVCVGRPLPGEVAVALTPTLLLEEELDDALAPDAVNGASKIEMPPRGAAK
jgi:hypothetical protein